jgi:hypothetical protein
VRIPPGAAKGGGYMQAVQVKPIPLRGCKHAPRGSDKVADAAFTVK